MFKRPNNLFYRFLVRNFTKNVVLKVFQRSCHITFLILHFLLLLHDGTNRQLFLGSLLYGRGGVKLCQLLLISSTNQLFILFSITGFRRLFAQVRPAAVSYLKAVSIGKTSVQ